MSNDRLRNNYKSVVSGVSRLLQSSVFIGRFEIPRIGQDFPVSQVPRGVWQAGLIYRGGIIILVPTGRGEVGRPIENHSRDFRSSQASGAMRDTSFARKSLTGYPVDGDLSMDDRQNEKTDSDSFRISNLKLEIEKFWLKIN